MGKKEREDGGGNERRRSKEWTYAHIRASPDKRIRHAVDEFARHAKVANLDLPMRVEEDVARLDVFSSHRMFVSTSRGSGEKKAGRTSVHDLMDLVQIVQSRHDRQRNLRQDRFRNRPNVLVDVVEGAFVHELHAHGDVRVLEVGAVESDDPRRVAVAHDLEFADDLLAGDFGGGDVDDLFEEKGKQGEHGGKGQSPSGRDEEKVRGKRTFLAMIDFVGTCNALLTVPPFPLPSSHSTCKSSFLKSNLNSTPTSKLASCSSRRSLYPPVLPPPLLPLVEAAVEAEEALVGGPPPSALPLLDDDESLARLRRLLREEPATCIGAGREGRGARGGAGLARSAAEAPERVPGLAASAERASPLALRFFLRARIPPGGGGRGFIAVGTWWRERRGRERFGRVLRVAEP
jgi:hypothetical protein